MKVRVWLNQDPNKHLALRLSGPQYCPSMYHFRKVATFDAPEGDTDELLIAERTFAALNEPDPKGYGTMLDLNCIIYHKVFPSLSVGDVVQVGDMYLICRDFGFDVLETKKVA